MYCLKGKFMKKLNIAVMAYVLFPVLGYTQLLNSSELKYGPQGNLTIFDGASCFGGGRCGRDTAVGLSYPATLINNYLASRGIDPIFIMGIHITSMKITYTTDIGDQDDGTFDLLFYYPGLHPMNPGIFAETIAPLKNCQNSNLEACSPSAAILTGQFPARLGLNSPNGNSQTAVIRLGRFSKGGSEIPFNTNIVFPHNGQGKFVFSNCSIVTSVSPFRIGGGCNDEEAEIHKVEIQFRPILGTKFTSTFGTSRIIDQVSPADLNVKQTVDANTLHWDRRLQFVYEPYDVTGGMDAKKTPDMIQGQPKFPMDDNFLYTSPTGVTTTKKLLLPVGMRLSVRARYVNAVSSAPYDYTVQEFRVFRELRRANGSTPNSFIVPFYLTAVAKFTGGLNDFFKNGFGNFYDRTSQGFAPIVWGELYYSPNDSLKVKFYYIGAGANNVTIASHRVNDSLRIMRNPLASPIAQRLSSNQISAWGNGFDAINAVEILGNILATQVDSYHTIQNGQSPTDLNWNDQGSQTLKNQGVPYLELEVPNRYIGINDLLGSPLTEPNKSSSNNQRHAYYAKIASVPSSFLPQNQLMTLSNTGLGNGSVCKNPAGVQEFNIGSLPWGATNPTNTNFALERFLLRYDVVYDNTTSRARCQVDQISRLFKLSIADFNQTSSQVVDGESNQTKLTLDPLTISRNPTLQQRCPLGIFSTNASLKTKFTRTELLLKSILRNDGKRTVDVWLMQEPTSNVAGRCYIVE